MLECPYNRYRRNRLRRVRSARYMGRYAIGGGSGRELLRRIGQISGSGEPMALLSSIGARALARVERQTST